jgi:hypothetical protein
MIPQKLALESFTEGDTWNGIPSITITVNGSTPASPISTVKMRFKRSGSVPSTPVELTSATSAQINLTNAPGWVFSVPEQIVAGLTFGDWTWRIRITDAAGKKNTYLTGEITVLEDV